MDLSGHTWLITGVSSGLGLALAHAVLEGGASVVGTVRRRSDAAPLQQRYPARVRVVELDLADRAAVAPTIERAIEGVARLDVVVNNAGFAVLGALEELDEVQMHRQMDVNFFGVLGVTRAVLPVFRRQRHGHLIQISSVAGRVAVPALSVYSASKFAIEGLYEAIAAEVAPFGVKVTIVEPLALRTDWARRSLATSPPSTSYAEIVDPIRKRLARATDDSLDPAAAAAAIAQVALRIDAPLRLAIGSDAAQAICTAMVQQLKELTPLL